MADVYDIAQEVIDLFEAKGLDQTQALAVLGLLVSGYLAQASADHAKSFCDAVLELVERTDLSEIPQRH